MSKYLAISKSQLVLPTMEKPKKGFGVITSPAFMSAYLKEVERYNQHLSGLPRYESDIELVPNQYYTEGVDFKWKPWLDKFNDGKRAVPLSVVAQPGKEVEGEKKETMYMDDPFVQKHLKNIKTKMKQYKDAHQLSGELIDKHIKPLFNGLQKASVEYFCEKGTISGAFYEALTSMIIEAIPGCADHLPSPGKQEPKRMSAFEHAILNQVDPEEAKKYKPYTKEEELEQRENHLKEQASKIRVNTGKQEGEGKRCATGCKTFTGGEKKHIAECPFYPGSLSEQYDKALPAQQIAADAWDACRNYIEYGIAGGYKDKETYLASLPYRYEWYSREFVEGFAKNWIVMKQKVMKETYGSKEYAEILHKPMSYWLDLYIKSLNK